MGADKICVYVETIEGKPNDKLFIVDRFCLVKELRSIVANKYHLNEDQIVLHGGKCNFYVMKDDKMVLDDKYLMDCKSFETLTSLVAMAKCSSKQEIEEITIDIAKQYSISADQVKINLVDHQEEMPTKFVIQLMCFSITVSDSRQSHEHKKALSHGWKVEELREKVATKYGLAVESVQLTCNNKIMMEKTFLYDSDYQMEYFTVKLVKTFNISSSFSSDQTNRNEFFSEFEFAFDRKDFEAIEDIPVTEIIDKMSSMFSIQDFLATSSDYWSANQDPNLMDNVQQLLPFMSYNEEFQNYLQSGDLLGRSFQIISNQIFHAIPDAENATVRKLKEEIAKLRENKDKNEKKKDENEKKRKWITSSINWPMVINTFEPICNIIGINVRDIFSDFIPKKQAPIILSRQALFFISLSRQMLRVFALLGPNLIDKIENFPYRANMEHFYFLDFHEMTDYENLSNIIRHKMLKILNDDQVKQLLCETFAEYDPWFKREVQDLFDDRDIMDSTLPVNKLILPKWNCKPLPPNHVSRTKLLDEIQHALMSQPDPNIVLLHGSSGCGKTTLCWEMLQLSTIENHFPGGVLILSSKDCLSEKDLLIRIKRHILSLRPLDPTSFETMDQPIRMDIHSTNGLSILTEQIKNILFKYYFPRFLVVIDVDNRKIASTIMELPLHFLVTSKRPSIFDSQHIQKILISSKLTSHEEDELWSKLPSKNIPRRCKMICRGSPMLINLFSSIVNAEGLFSDQSTLLSLSTSSSIKTRYKRIFEKSISDQKIEKKYFLWLKVLPSDVNFTAETMTLLWDLPDKEEVSIFLEQMVQMSFIQHDSYTKEEKPKPIFVLHSLQKVALKYCKDPLKEADYLRMIIDRLGRECNKQWYKLPQAASCLWPVLTNSLLHESQKDPHCLKELLDLRNVNMMLKTMGLSPTVKFLQRIARLMQNCQETYEFTTQLHRFLWRRGQFFRMLKYHGISVGSYEIVQIALMEPNNSLIKQKAMEIFQNQETINNFAFYWSPQNVNESNTVDFSFHFDDQICGIYSSLKSPNVFLVATANGTICRLSEFQEETFKMENVQIKSMHKIERLNHFVVVKRLSLKNERQDVELEFYQPDDFDNCFNQKSTPYAKLLMFSEEITSVAYQKRQKNTCAFFIASRKNYPEFIIHQAIFHCGHFHGHPNPLFVFAASHSTINVHLHTFNNFDGIWNLWHVKTTTNEEYSLAIFDQTQGRNITKKLSFPVSNFAFPKSDLVAFLHSNKLTVYGYHNGVIHEEYEKSFSPSITTMSIIQSLCKIYPRHQHQVFTLNRKQTICITKSSSILSVTHDDFTIKVSKFKFNDTINDDVKSGIESVVLWKKLPIQNENEVFYNLMTIDNAHRLHFAKAQLTTQHGLRRMNIISDECDYYKCHLLPLSGNIPLIKAMDRNGEQKLICPIQQKVNVFDETQTSIYFSFYIEEEERLVLGCKHANMGIQLSQYHRGQHEQDYPLKLHVYTNDVLHSLFKEYPFPNKFDVKLLDSCMPMVLAYPVLIRRLCISVSTNNDVFIWSGNIIEFYRVNWNANDQRLVTEFCCLSIDRNSTRSWYFNDLKLCNCHKHFTFFINSRVEIYKLPTMSSLLALEFDPYYNLHVSFRPHDTTNELQNCIFAKFSAVSFKLTIYSIAHDDTVNEIGQANFYFKKYQKPSLSWSQTGKFLYVKDEWKNIWTYEFNNARTNTNENCLEFVNHICLANMQGQCPMLSIDDDLVA